MEQGLQYGAEVSLGEEAKTLERVEQDGEELLALTTEQGNTYLSRKLIITAGHGAFEPRRLGVDNVDDWLGHGLHYVVREKAQFAREALRDRRRGRFGARLDARPAGHRRACRSSSSIAGTSSARSRARSTRRAGSSRRAHVRILTPHEVRDVHGNGLIEEVTIEKTDDQSFERVGCDALITLLGFVSHLGAIAEWGIELHGKRQLKIDATTCETSMPGVYAAGDGAGYEGKITLITIGMGEAAIAANNAIAAIRGEKAQPKYSTD